MELTIDCFPGKDSKTLRTVLLMNNESFAGIYEAVRTIRELYPKSHTLWFVGDDGTDIARVIPLPNNDATAIVETIYVS